MAFSGGSTSSSRRGAPFDPSSGRDEAWAIEVPLGSLALRASGGLVAASAMASTPGVRARHRKRGAARAGTPKQPGSMMGAPTGRGASGSAADTGRDRATGSFYRLDPDGSCARVADGSMPRTAPPSRRTGGPAITTAASASCGASTATRTAARSRTAASSSSSTRAAERRMGRSSTPTAATGWLMPEAGASCARIPLGRVDRIVQLPVEIPTSAAFGGADGRTLFITTARYSSSRGTAINRWPARSSPLTSALGGPRYQVRRLSGRDEKVRSREGTMTS